MQDTPAAGRLARRILSGWLRLLAIAEPAEVAWQLDAYDRCPRGHRLPPMRVLRGVALVLLVIASACGKRNDSEAAAVPANAKPVRVDGSSTVYLVSKAVGEEAAKAGIKIEVAESGTTAGFKKLCAGEIDVSGASRPVDQSELDACNVAGIEVVELPIGYDGIALVVNSANTWIDHLTMTELRAIWSPDSAGKVTTWKQVAERFPDRPLHLFGPGKDSGTFDYFTQAVTGKQRASRTDYTSSEDDTVLVRGVTQDENALGYFGYAYFVRNRDKLRVLPIDDGNASNGEGPIAPSRESIERGTYQPLSRPIFIYVNATAAKRAEVDTFVTLYLKVARELSAEIGYVSLPARAYELARERYTSRTSGSMFSGVTPIGVTMEKLLEAESR